MVCAANHATLPRTYLLPFLFPFLSPGFPERTGQIRVCGWLRREGKGNQRGIFRLFWGETGRGAAARVPPHHSRAIGADVWCIVVIGSGETSVVHGRCNGFALAIDWFELDY